MVRGEENKENTRIDIEKPKWDQRNYTGRARHFLTLTNPLNVFASSNQLERARDIVQKYRYMTCLTTIYFSQLSL